MERQMKARGRRCLSSLYHYGQVKWDVSVIFPEIQSNIAFKPRLLKIDNAQVNSFYYVFVAVVVLETLNPALQKQDSLSSNGKVSRPNKTENVKVLLAHLQFLLKKYNNNQKQLTLVYIQFFLL